MFLKTLQIKGFKSFADTASLELEPGVTVVVGPNGSGKSNVVDAIGWVLGAQAPSAVRSQKMDDVIFAGTAKRPALGRAEVALTIDNSAGLLPIEFTEVTLSRVLFRSGDSEYQINGVPCRLLDIQELLSDSGVGRQQHVIISQGQIDAVLNAKPEDRRLIIEEAAGVLKFRRRKEKAQRRLDSTEANLTRIIDMLREVKRQRGPLKRQAEAAQRHESVVAEARAIKVHLAGRDLTRLRAQTERHADQQRELGHTERTLRANLAGADSAISQVEGELSVGADAALGESFARYEALRERARGLSAVLGERLRGVERDRNAFVDEAVVATLAVEHAELVEELVAVDVATQEAGAELADATEEHGQAVRARVAFEESVAHADTRAPAAAEVRGELAALDQILARAGEDERHAAEAESVAEGKQASLASELEAMEAVEARLAHELTSLSERAESASAALRSATATHDAAALRSERADAEHHRWAARADALAQALDAARARAGADRLDDLEGVLGTLLDVVEVDAGLESAFEAAIGDSLAAVVVDGPDRARRALEALAAQAATGDVLAADSRAGRGDAAPTVRAQMPPGTRPLRSAVRGRSAGVDAVLDVLLGDVVVVEGDWRRALDVSSADDGLVVVTAVGDRFCRKGWRLGASGTGATGAALEEARERSVTAESDAAAARSLLASRRADLETAREAETNARQATQDTAGEQRRHADHRQRLTVSLHEAAEAAQVARRRRADVAARRAANERRREELMAKLPALEAADAEAAEVANGVAVRRRELEEIVTATGAARAEAEVRCAGIAERRRNVTERIARVETRLERNEAERELAERRHAVLSARAAATVALTDVVEAHSERIEAVLGVLRSARQEQIERTRGVSERLDAMRRERTAHERELEVVRERRQRSELEDTETRLRLESAVAALRDELDCEPDTAIAAECPELPDGSSAAARLRELERDLKLMGPINPLALEEYNAVNERIEFLEGQLDDIRSTRRELTKVITSIDGEISSVFAAAFADVSANFDHLFQTLFPGGSGRLSLTEPGDLLNTGIDIEARPSGKNVRKLSLLSGGERSLTALAYLFAVFRSRPSPFYVMDEVEAALDDVNLHRFLGLVAEFRQTAQLLIVSHQKRTMEAADVLYGVTMEPGGSSRVLSERIGAAAD